MAFTEARAKLAYSIVKSIDRKVSPKTTLREVSGATLESASKLANADNNYKEAANHYFTIANNTRININRAEADDGLIQMLINNGSFGQARDRIDQFRQTLRILGLGSRDTFYYQARVVEKLGWIADYEAGFGESFANFTQVRSLLRKIPRADWRDDKETSLDSTAVHFSGRALLGLAYLGINTKSNARMASVYFRDDWTRFEQLREQGESYPANEGFNHGWLARCEIVMGNAEGADAHIKKARELFTIHDEQTNSQGGEAHVNMLQGEYHLKFGIAKLALENFEQARNLWQDNPDYPPGRASASLGKAAAAAKRKNPFSMFKNLKEAYTAHKLVTTRAILTGVNF